MALLRLSWCLPLVVSGIITYRILYIEGYNKKITTSLVVQRVFRITLSRFLFSLIEKHKFASLRIKSKQILVFFVGRIVNVTCLTF